MEQYLASEPRPDEAADARATTVRSILRLTAPVEPAPGLAPEDAPGALGPDDAPPRLRRARRVVERETTEVTAAILAVGGGRVPWVMVCNLRHPGVAVEALRGLAAELGLEVALVPRSSGSGLDVLVRPQRP